MRPCFSSLGCRRIFRAISESTRARRLDEFWIISAVRWILIWMNFGIFSSLNCFEDTKIHKNRKIRNGKEINQSINQSTDSVAVAVPPLQQTLSILSHFVTLYIWRKNHTNYISKHKHNDSGINLQARNKKKTVIVNESPLSTKFHCQHHRRQQQMRSLRNKRTNTKKNHLTTK